MIRLLKGGVQTPLTLRRVLLWSYWIILISLRWSVTTIYFLDNVVFFLSTGSPEVRGVYPEYRLCTQHIKDYIQRKWKDCCCRSVSMENGDLHGNIFFIDFTYAHQFYFGTSNVSTVWLLHHMIFMIFIIYTSCHCIICWAEENLILPCLFFCGYFKTLKLWKCTEKCCTPCPP